MLGVFGHTIALLFCASDDGAGDPGNGASARGKGGAARGGTATGEVGEGPDRGGELSTRQRGV